MSKHRTCLEKGNAGGDPIEIRGRLPSDRKQSDKGTVRLSWGGDDGMYGKETRRNTREACLAEDAHPQRRVRKGQLRSEQVADRSVVAKKRPIPVEPRDLSSSTAIKEGTDGRLATAYQLRNVFGNFSSRCMSKT